MLDIGTSLVVCMLSRVSGVRLLATLWTVTCQVPVSMGFSRQEYWSRLPVDLPNSGIEPASLVSCIGRQVLYHWLHRVVKNPPCHAGGSGLMPVWGTKIPHVMDN